MDIQDVAAAATIAGLLLAVPTLMVGVFQLQQQQKLSHREKMVRVYFDCTSTYADLQRERAEFDDDATAANLNRRKRNLIALWDLLAAEYEFATAGLLPHQIFVEWFGLLHADLHAGSTMAGSTLRESWLQGAPFAGRIFPRFAKIMQKALEEPDFGKMRRHLQASLRADRSVALFRQLQ